MAKTGKLQAITVIRTFLAEPREPGSAGEWLANRFAAYLDQRGAITLETALDLKPGAGEAPRSQDGTG